MMLIIALCNMSSLRINDEDDMEGVLESSPGQFTAASVEKKKEDDYPWQFSAGKIKLLLKR